MVKRGLFEVWILSIVTCGIYFLYLQVSMAGNCAREVGEQRSGALDVILIIITCGLYGIYLNYLIGTYIEKIGTSRNVIVEDVATIALILSLVGGQFFAMLIFQEKINNFLGNSI